MNYKLENPYPEYLSEDYSGKLYKNPDWTAWEKGKKDALEHVREALQNPHRTTDDT